MKIYKISFFLPQTLKKEEVQKNASEVEKIIQDDNGILVEERKKEKRKLSKPIEEVKNVYLVSIKFQIPPEMVSKIKEAVQAREQVLRVFLKKKKRKKSKKREVPGEKIKKEASKKEKKDTKVELREIEEKLEEILDES